MTTIFRPLTFLLFAGTSLLAFAQQMPQSRQFVQPEDSRVRRVFDRRLALVIGNGNYRSVNPLPNALHDAEDVATTLQELHFEVLGGQAQLNQTASQIRRLIAQFGDKLKQEGGVGLFYYAGHGIQAKGKDYLIPVDVRRLKASNVDSEAVAITEVLGEIRRANNGFNIVILDACRANAFVNYVSSTYGLAENSDAPEGTLIAYAASPSRVADDGDGRNGLYTSQLLRFMRQPGLSLPELFLQIRIAVRDISARKGEKQTPWELNSLPGRFYFVGPEPVADKASTVDANKGAVNALPRPSDDTPPAGPKSTSEPAEQFSRAGERYRNTGELAKAEIEYRLAAQIDPDRVDWHTSLAEILNDEGKFGAAEIEFRQAAKLQPANPEWHSRLGDVLYSQATYLFQQTKYKQSEIEHRLAVEIDPGNGYRRTLLGAVLKAEGKEEEANSELTRAVGLCLEATRREPNNPRSWFRLGNAYGWLNKYADAENAYRLAVRLDSGNAEHHYGLAAMLANENNWTDAEPELRKAVELNPRDARYHHYLAIALRRLRRCGECIAEFQEAVKLQPNFFHFRFDLACALFGQAQYEEAEKQAKAAIELNPNEATIHNLLGNILCAQEKYVNAESEYRKAIDLQAGQAFFYSGLADALEGQDRLAEAEQAIRTALNIQSSIGSFHSTLGNILRREEKLDDAEAEARLAIQLDSTNPEHFNVFGLVLFDAGKLSDAEEPFTKSTQMDPDCPTYFFNLGNTFKAQRKWKEAAIALREAVRLSPTDQEYKQNLREVEKFTSGRRRLK